MKSKPDLKIKPNLKLSLVALSVSLAFNSDSVTAADVFAPWLTQIGLNTSILSASKWGYGNVLGVVDTGIATNNAFFTPGQVSASLSSCAALSFKCSKGAYDDNGHGTAVAAIAAGNKLTPYGMSAGRYSTTINSIVSVAPSTNIVAEKVLNAAGSGFSTDVANGIKKAADAGASVINVSITYGNSTDIVNAINYATAKGAYIVWAGGNSGTALLNGSATTGLNVNAMNHLLFVGSVDAKNNISTFSNKPGTGTIDINGAKTPYTFRWVMAPGENILAPYSPTQPSSWGSWSGTSMSAPIVSGSLILLESAWPILKTNSQAANLLLMTATDLGTKGTDSTYGYGLINLGKAFQPYGTLTVKDAKGKTLAVPSIKGALISSGALGSLASVQSKLANYTAFDSYSRNFTVNMSNMIKVPSSTAILNPLPTNVKSAPKAIKLVDGTVMSSWMQEPATALDHLGEFNYNPATSSENRQMYLAMDYKDGTTLAFGNGYPAQYGYSQAFFGDPDMAMLSSQLNADGLSSLADGGAMISYGKNLDENTRLALSWSGSTTQITADPTSTLREASNVKVGVSYKFDDNLTGGISVGSLAESNSMLGSTYSSGSALGFNTNNQSYSLGLSAGYKLDANNSILFESGFSVTKGAQGAGLISGTTDIFSQAYGASFLSKNLMAKDDRLTLSLKQPLRVTSGQVGIRSASVDALGYAVYSTELLNLAPIGHEVDFRFAYDTPLAHNQSLQLQAGYREDVLNIAGTYEASVGMSWEMQF